MKQKFIKCNTCGTIITMVDEKNMPSCCGAPMVEMAYSTDAEETHVPVVTITGSKVKVTVGNGTHPMTPDHAIKWVSLETRTGVQRKDLAMTDELVDILFMMPPSDELVSAHAYCNKHGLYRDKTHEVGRGGDRFGGR